MARNILIDFGSDSYVVDDPAGAVRRLATEPNLKAYQIKASTTRDGVPVCEPVALDSTSDLAAEIRIFRLLDGTTVLGQAEVRMSKVDA